MPLHIPVMLMEAVEGLAIDPDGFYVDGTFGRGGHSRSILERLGPQGRLLAIDRDPHAELAAASFCEDRRFCFRHSTFSRISEIVKDSSLDKPVNGVLLDLGLSSPQLDQPARGLSFSQDGPLDMRMDPTKGEPISAWLAYASQKEISRVLRDYGEERFAGRIARQICKRRTSKPFTNTLDLAETISRVVIHREKGKHPATRSFQAFRILVNNELDELRSCLNSLPDILATGARVVVISFHSLEDRIVKRFFQGRNHQIRLPRGLPITQTAVFSQFKMQGSPRYPNAEEVVLNPRARSAIMRVAEFVS